MLVRNGKESFTWLFWAVFFTAHGWVIGWVLGTESVRAEACNAGVAEYIITNPETGETEFKWKECECK